MQLVCEDFIILLNFLMTVTLKRTTLSEGNKFLAAQFIKRIRSHPQLQVVEPPNLIYFIYFHFVLIITSVFFALECCLGWYLCFCFVLGTFP